MKSKRDNILESAKLVTEELQTVNSAVELEAALTQSAFGHEYALMNLEPQESYVRREELLAQMEEHKRNYFWAREQLLELDPKKLVSIEEEIQKQKDAILRHASFILPDYLKKIEAGEVENTTIH